VSEPWGNYSRILVITALMACVLVLALNCLIDPLWYLGGNRLFPQNYAYNERFSKTNLYLRDPRRYDCIILGSSRTTLLNEAHINSHTCFNFAFSAANVRELIEFAHFVAAKGRPPELVIVGVDIRNFWRQDLKSNTPEFVKDRQTPPPLLKNYLSLGALGFSLRTLWRDSPHPRYYREDFICDVLPGIPPYEPLPCLPVDKQEHSFELDNLRFYHELRAIFPHASFIGYVPPISAWGIAPLYHDKTLPDYLKAAYAVAQLFDRFYDFTVPSAVTTDPSQSYDMDHYTLEINARIAKILNGGDVEFGLALHSLSQNGYQRAFTKAVTHFLNQHDLKITSRRNCPVDLEVR
jgi:hypothetical protein